MTKIQDIKVYDLEELSKLLKIHIVTLRRYIREGKLKAVKLGKAYRVTDENLKAFLNG